MEYCYYELKKAPDFSLSKYASLSETGPSGVIIQHRAFWRQINQWGRLFHGSIHFIYQYDPDQEQGERMKLVLRFDVPDGAGKESVRQIMSASILAPYYEELRYSDDSALDGYDYDWQINLLKKERFITSSANGQGKFYTVSQWEMNAEANSIGFRR